MAQEIWKLLSGNDPDLVIRTEIDYFQTHFVGEPMSNWKPPPVRIQGKSKRLRDFVSWMNSAPVLSLKAKDCLDALIGPHCQLFPLIELRRKQYYAVNVTTLVDCLDTAKSEILYASDEPGHILAIDCYVFKPGPGPSPIFKLPQYDGAVFVTRPFVDAVIAGGLRGAVFADPTRNELEKLVRGEPLNVVPGVLE